MNFFPHFSIEHLFLVGIVFVYDSESTLKEFIEKTNQILQKTRYPQTLSYALAFHDVHGVLVSLDTSYNNKRSARDGRVKFHNPQVIQLLFEGEETSKKWKCPFYVLSKDWKRDSSLQKSLVISMTKDFWFEIFMLEDNATQEKILYRSTQATCTSDPFAKNKPRSSSEPSRYESSANNTNNNTNTNKKDIITINNNSRMELCRSKSLSSSKDPSKNFVNLNPLMNGESHSSFDTISSFTLL
jgi:hypothetical protein